MSKFTMRKRIILAVICIAVVLAWSAFLKPPSVDVKKEAFAVLEQMQKSGMQRLDAEIVDVERQFRDVVDREEQLEQVLPQTEQWLAQKRTAEYGDIPCG